MGKIFTAALLLMMMILTGCGSDNSAKNKKNDTLNVMLHANALSLDTAQAIDVMSFEVISYCIDGLMQVDADDKTVPAIAKSYDVSADGKTYTFHLRDAKWANGAPVTANDFVFAWRRYCQKAGEYSYMFGSTVACVKNADAVIKGADPKTLGVTAPDSKTLVVELDTPVPIFLSMMSFPPFYPINEKFYNSIEDGKYGTSPETFLSNGAFELTEYLPDTEKIKLKKNNSYWDAESVSLENLHCQFVDSSDNALIAFRNGTLNVANISGTQAEHVKKDPAFYKNLQTFSDGALTYLSFNQDPKNHHAGTLTNVNLRLAVSNAIDRESLAENYVMAGAKSTYTAIPVDFAPNVKTGKFFSVDQKKFSNYVNFNVTAAQEFLQRAKTELGRDNFELNLIYSKTNGEIIIKVAQAVKAQVEENLPGVTINLQPMPKAEYLNNYRSNNYDIALVSWVPDYNDPMAFLMIWTTESCINAEHWSNADYDKIVADCMKGDLATNYDARWNAMYNAEKILLENAVIAPLYTETNVVLISPNVTGIEFHSAGINRVFKHVRLK